MTGGALGIDRALRLAAQRPARAALRAQYLADSAQTEVVAEKLFVPRAYIEGQIQTARSSGAGGGVADWRSTTDSKQAGLRMNWQGPMGTRLDLAVANVRQQTRPGQWTASTGLQTSLTVSQPLLRGAGVRVATATQRTARRALQVAELQFSLRLADDAMALVNAFAQALSAQQRVVVAQDALKAAQVVRQAIAQYLAAGVRAAADERQAQLSVSQQEANLNSARAAHETAMLNLAPLLGCPLPSDQRTGWRLEAPSKEHAPAPADAANSEQIVDALPEFTMRRLALEDAELALDVAQNARKPDLSLVMTLARSPGGPVIAGTDASHTANSSVGLNLNLPLNDYEAEAAAAAAYQRVLQARSDLEQSRAELTARVRSAALGVGNAQRQLQLAREQLHFAVQVLGDEDARLRAGRSTLLEWQTALSTRSASQVALQQAELDVYVAQLSYWRAAGNLLQELGLNMAQGHGDGH
ncbi:outer membrane protein TolC [Variovorax boronicumulans]|uniref:TolC family protein n=1 Tax=Variovorax boronicumulans TaxID=436515 RepID=UPI002780BAC5|nr:TolC family protein [Variovorax boronicumulans]MDQ0086066.1 outer membrane protein TolC [Variovorax boronicumulans]